VTSVLVTGASHGGIGGAICKRLVASARQRGDRPRITITATGDNPDLALLGAVLEDAGAHVWTVRGDLTNPEFPGELVEAAAGHGDGLDVVVSNAGKSQHGPLAGLGLLNWNHTFALHTRAAWLLAQAAYPFLAVSKGSFIATGSVSGTVPHAGREAYPAAKAALIMLCQCLAQEWAPDGIRVNVVSPGLVSTAAAPKPDAGSVVPLGRPGDPEDVAAAVAFLTSPEAGFITGQNIVTDGGLLGAGLGLAGRYRHG
jgi:glucose 1-dehydrogenase